MSPAKTASRGTARPKANTRGGTGDAARGVADDSSTAVNAGSEPAPAWTPFVEALATYYRTSQESWRREDLEQQAADAYAAVLKAMQGAPDVAEVQQRALSAQRSLMEKVRDAAPASDATQQLAQAYADYVAELADVPADRDIRDRVNEAYGEYLQVFVDASSLGDVQANTATAYHDYLQALRDAWASAEPDELDVETLAIIAQSVMSAALGHAGMLSAIGQAALANPAVTAAAPGQ